MPCPRALAARFAHVPYHRTATLPPFRTIFFILSALYLLFAVNQFLQFKQVGCS